MICLSCTKLDLQKYPKHSKQGVGVCAHESVAGVFVSFAYRRDCREFKAADEKTAQKRITWYDSIKVV